MALLSVSTKELLINELNRKVKKHTTNKSWITSTLLQYALKNMSDEEISSLRKKDPKKSRQYRTSK